MALDKKRALSGEELVDGRKLMALFAPQGGPFTYTLPMIDGRTGAPHCENFEKGEFAKVAMMIGATSADRVYPSTSTALFLRRGVGARPGAQHATDIPIFFDSQSAEHGEETGVRHNAMGDAMSSYLVNFAKNGAPNTGWGLKFW